MVHHHALKDVDCTFRYIMQLDNSTCADKIFGGKIMVSEGDFRELLPIMPRKGRANTINALIANSNPI